MKTLTGTVPTALGDSTTLQTLYLTNNQLTTFLIDID